MKECGIYAWWDALTGECLYVGKTSDLAARKKQHIYMLLTKRHLTAFSEWFEESGCDVSRLIFEVLETMEPVPDEVASAEMKWFYELAPKFYGMKPDQNGSWTHSSESKAKISRGLTFLPPVSLDTDAILTRYATGESAGSIARSLDAKIEDIVELLKDAEVLRSISEKNRMAHAQKIDREPYSERIPPSTELAKLYFEQKLSANTIARMFDVNPSVIGSALRANGYKLRTQSEAAAAQRKHTDQARLELGPTKEWLHEQYHVQNRSLREIAEELDWSSNRVRYRIILLGVGMKPRGVGDWGGKVGERRREQYSQREQAKLAKLPAKEELEKLYLTDLLSLSEIGAMAGVTKAIVAKGLVAAQIRLRTPAEQVKVNGIRLSMKAHAKSPTKDELQDAYMIRRLTPAQIAEEFSVSRSMVFNRLDLYGVRPRNKR